MTLGGGGECPLLLIGIEPERLADLDTVQQLAADVHAARELMQNKAYRAAGLTFAAARARLKEEQTKAVEAIPPIKRERRTRGAGSDDGEQDGGEQDGGE